LWKRKAEPKAVGSAEKKYLKRCARLRPR